MVGGNYGLGSKEFAPSVSDKELCHDDFVCFRECIVSCSGFQQLGWAHTLDFKRLRFDYISRFGGGSLGLPFDAHMPYEKPLTIKQRFIFVVSLRP